MEGGRATGRPMSRINKENEKVMSSKENEKDKAAKRYKGNNAEEENLEKKKTAGLQTHQCLIQKRRLRGKA